MIRVAVAAPSLALRAGLRALLSADPQLDVVGEAATVSGALRFFPHVDVLVVAGLAADSGVDIQEPGDEHVSLGSSLPGLLVLAGEDATDARFPRSMTWRAWGILPADCTAEELHVAVKALQQGLLVGDPALLRPYFPAESGSTEGSEIEALTEREAQVLQKLAQGLANKQIASVLGISEHTVKFHISAIYSKLGATNRTEAVRIGVRQGLVIL